MLFLDVWSRQLTKHGVKAIRNFAQAQLQVGNLREAESELLGIVSCEAAPMELCLEALSKILDTPGLHGPTVSAAFILLKRKPTDILVPVQLVELILGKAEGVPDLDSMALNILKDEAVMATILQVLI